MKKSALEKLITSRINPKEEFMDLPKLWFREIRPSLGEYKKLPKYGIIGKIFLTRLSEILTTTHRMTIKILWEFGSLECCMVHPTISLSWPKSLSIRRYQSVKSSSQPYLHYFKKMPTEERERSSRRWNLSSWIHLVCLYPLGISLSKCEGKMKWSWCPRVRRELVKC